MKFNLQLKKPVLEVKKGFFSSYLSTYLSLFCLVLLLCSHTSFGQTITINIKNGSLENTLKDVAKQANHEVFYNPTEIKKASAVNLTVKNAALKETLDLIFSNQPLFKYAVTNKTIVVTVHSKEVKKAGINVRGRVFNSKNQPFPNVIVAVEGTSLAAVTNADGGFAIDDAPSDGILVCSGLTIETVRAKIDGQNSLSILATEKVSELENVMVVVNNGYQKVAKERATGSFELIDAKTINRSTSSNILERLNGLVSGLAFVSKNNSVTNPLATKDSEISIRGLSTINSNRSPLIVVDNFPYKGNINNINPNDVETITVLKDAAAASIWGAQAGNGVIVITTKKGKYNQKTTVDFNSSISITSKPDLFSQRQIATSDYIDLEKNFFNAGFYNSYFNSPVTNSYVPTSPVVEILQKIKTGAISATEGNKIIDSYRNLDVRNDYLKYIYSPAINQEYSFNVRGGSDKSRYIIALGYNNDVYANKNSAQRYTINANNTFKLSKNLEISLPLSYTQSKENSSPNRDLLNGDAIYPYAQFADENGNPLAVTHPRGVMDFFNQETIAKGFYSYAYKPLEEFRVGNNSILNRREIRVSPSLNYRFLNGFQADFQYQYNIQNSQTNLDQSTDFFSVRRTINTYTQINPSGSLSYPINRANFLTLGNQTTTGQYIRAQLNYNKTIGDGHRLDAVLGYEFSENKFNSNTNSWYGYNPTLGTIQTNVDYNTFFPQYSTTRTNRIPFLPSQLLSNYNLLVSKYANASYTYKERYILSGSSRIDQANIQGASSGGNQNALWSAGFGWNVDRESFYKVAWLPSLKLRTTYGIQGNIPSYTRTSVGPTDVSPLATISYSSNNNAIGLNYSTLTAISNPYLTWEKTAQLNVGLDFASKNRILSGSIEYYYKKGDGLIAPYPIDPTYGQSNNIGNIANLEGSGIDVNITSKNIDANFKWDTRYIFNHNTDKITKYLVPITLSSILAQATSYPSFTSPIEGNAVYGVYALKSAGLDPLTGDPRGYDVDGNISKDYTSLTLRTPLKDLVYYGSSNPTYFGSLLNNFSYKGFEMSVNINFQAGFYFHRQSANYYNLYGGNFLGGLGNGADYENRWQKPGDEAFTVVPSAADPNSTLVQRRDQFYLSSSDLVVKGDHVRLQDIVLRYNIASDLIKKLKITAMQLYFNATLNTVIWKENKLGIDPQNRFMNPSKTFSWGLRASF